MHSDKRDSQTKTRREQKYPLPLQALPPAILKGSLLCLMVQLIFKHQQVIFQPHCERKGPQHC